MAYCCNYYQLSFTKYEYVFGFNATNSSFATPLVSSFIFPMTNLFESAYYFDLVK